jgi:long-subunit acyl-CoA synthetase (AMP-forming)
MKKLFIVALLMAVMTSFAQSKEGRSRTPQRANMEKMTPQERTEKRIEKMTKELNLDVKQQEKMKQLLPSKKQQELPRRQR